ncbi:MAG: hypothetical protein R6V49_08315 [Bacteroidales bacterium]
MGEGLSGLVTARQTERPAKNTQMPDPTTKRLRSERISQNNSNLNTPEGYGPEEVKRETLRTEAFPAFVFSKPKNIPRIPCGSFSITAMQPDFPVHSSILPYGLYRINLL